MIEDIKGYKPHTEDKIGKVNAIKDAEIRLGLIFKALDEEISAKIAAFTPEDTPESDAYIDEQFERQRQLYIAKERLKEASMWACRAVFSPEEKY